MAGVGSPILGDDGVGIHVVRELGKYQTELPAGTELCELGTGGLALADLAGGMDRLVVVDAMVTGAPAGTVRVLSGAEVARAVHLAQGHEPSLPVALGLAQKLLGKRMPAEVWLVAIEAVELRAFSEKLSPAVEAAIPEAVERVRELLAR